MAECLEAMEVKPEQKHRLRTDHKNHSRDDYNGKNKSERRPRKSRGHKKKERAMVAGARDMDSSPFYSSSSSSDEEENRHKAFAAWHIAPQARRATRMTRAPTPRKR
jgi:hypothetical protein